MRIFLTGADGQLGLELQRVLTGHQLELGLWPAFDIRQPESIKRIAASRPHVVIHAAAYTDVDGAERDPDAAWAVNAEGTERVAIAANEAGARLVYISTDYVFDGQQRQPYTEQDVPNPLNAYGRSKLEGERRALVSCPRSLIVRTAWLYAARGRNFVRSIMQQAAEGQRLRVVADQHGNPTAAPDLAKAIAHLVFNTDALGIVHAVGRGHCSWHEFATAIVHEMRLRTDVAPIRSDEAARLAPRPAYAVLGTERLSALGFTMPHWRESLSHFIKEQSVAHVQH